MQNAHGAHLGTDGIGHIAHKGGIKGGAQADGVGVKHGMRDYRPTQCFAMEERRNAVGRMLHHILLHISQAGSQCFGFFADIQQGNFADAAGKIFGSQVGVLTDQHGAAQLADFFFQRKFFQQCRSPLARCGGDKAVGDVHGQAPF